MHTPHHPLPCPPCSSALLKNDNVRFAGYKHPHPLDHDIEVKLRVKRDDRYVLVGSCHGCCARLRFVTGGNGMASPCLHMLALAFTGAKSRPRK